MEDFYITPDFVYRELNLLAHYDSDNIYYLSADTWRDADGDGTNDVRLPNTKGNVKEAIKNWLTDIKKSDGNDINLIYFFDHGGENESNEYSTVVVDSNRDGDYGDFPGDFIGSKLDMPFWIPYYGSGGIGRLTFIMEACYIGLFLKHLSRPYQNQNIIVSTDTQYPVPHSAAGETGQDWPAFSHMLFKTMGNGSTSLSTAFNTADEHVDQVNFQSVYGKLFDRTWEYVDQDAKFDDNGDAKGSDYTLPNPNTGNMQLVYKGPFMNNYWMSKNIKLLPSTDYDFYVDRARVRFEVRRGLLPQVTADLYEFDFHSGSWVSPTGYHDPFNGWDNEPYAYDDDVNTKAGYTEDGYSGWIWTDYIELTLPEPLKCDKIRFRAWYSALHCSKIEIEVNCYEGILGSKTGL